MKYKFLTGDVNWQTYGGKFISPKQNNGDFDYWLVMEVFNWEEMTGYTDNPTYHIDIKAVAPSEVPQNEIDQALSSCGLVELYEDNNDVLLLVEALSDCGIFATLYQKDGNNLRTLMQNARKESDLIVCLFGFYMDNPQNRLGSSGWDFIKGDITAGLYK